MLGDLFTGGSFSESLDGETPILDPSERSHMADVGGLVRILAALEVIAVVVLLISGWMLRRERARRGRLLLAGALAVGAAAVVLGLFFALAFETAFAAFHGIFFKVGTWQFGPESNLIRLFPEPFWFETSLFAGLSIVLSAALAIWLARRGMRSISAEH
jgi:integral membrane protein (TIGR01906 family)